MTLVSRKVCQVHPCCINRTADWVAEELSEEDQQLKSELEMLVERLQVTKIIHICLHRLRGRRRQIQILYKPALEAVKDKIKNIHIVNDRSPKTTQVLTPSLPNA